MLRSQRNKNICLQPHVEITGPVDKTTILSHSTQIPDTNRIERHPKHKNIEKSECSKTLNCKKKQSKNLEVMEQKQILLRPHVEVTKQQ